MAEYGARSVDLCCSQKRSEFSLLVQYPFYRTFAWLVCLPIPVTLKFEAFRLLNQAVKRVVERNKLTEEEALKRIDSQMTNEEKVARSNVILSTLWEKDVTQKQVILVVLVHSFE